MKKSEFTEVPLTETSSEIVRDIYHKKPEQEPTHRLSQNEIADSKDIVLKPTRYVSDTMPFDEKYRKEFEDSKRLVLFIAEHREIIGEKIEKWTKKYRGQPAEFWEIPTGIPVWGPLYLAEDVSRSYRRLKADNKIVASDSGNHIIGGVTVDTTIQRLDAIPATKGRRTFGAFGA